MDVKLSKINLGGTYSNTSSSKGLKLLNRELSNKVNQIKIIPAARYKMIDN